MIVNNIMKTLLIEAIFVGILTVFVGILITFIIKNCTNTNVPKNCRNHTMEMNLFITGLCVHLICEMTGINKWYCKNGNACHNKLA